MKKKSQNNKSSVKAGAMPVSSNPFIASLEEYLSTDNLAERLAFSPLDGVDITNIGGQARLDLLDRLQEEYFEPMLTSLEITTRLYRVIRKGYLNRDPTKPSSRKMTMELAGYSGQELSTLPWFASYAKGMTIIGVTGLGKSYEVKRALQLLPQCVDHGRSQAAGWTGLKQVTWLYVAMSHDGSLGGLLLQILYALDDVIGTQYSQDKAFTKASNEKLAVRLGIIFRNHGLGALIIDEIQSRNFEGHGRGGFAATFFLRLLNFGIPVVLMGNPLGIRALYSYSQDVRRIGSGGTIHLHPLQEEDFDWKDCLAPALWGQNLMPDPSPIDDPDGKLLFMYSGGIRDYACRIVIASQRLALDLGARHVTEEHMRLAFIGSDFSDKERNLIAGFCDKNPILLQQFEDIPWEEYAVRWGLYSETQSFTDIPHSAKNSAAMFGDDASGKPATPGKVKPVPQKDLEQIKRMRTRKVNTASKKTALRESLNSSDMRADGLQEFLISGLEKVLSDDSGGLGKNGK